jgi:hypothetical protein
MELNATQRQRSTQHSCSLQSNQSESNDHQRPGRGRPNCFKRAAYASSAEPERLYLAPYIHCGRAQITGSVLLYRGELPCEFLLPQQVCGALTRVLAQRTLFPDVEGGRVAVTELTAAVCAATGVTWSLLVPRMIERVFVHHNVSMLTIAEFAARYTDFAWTLCE